MLDMYLYLGAYTSVQPGVLEPTDEWGTNKTQQSLEEETRTKQNQAEPSINIAEPTKSRNQTK